MNYVQLYQERQRLILKIRATPANQRGTEEMKAVQEKIDKLTEELKRLANDKN